MDIMSVRVQVPSRVQNGRLSKDCFPFFVLNLIRPFLLLFVIYENDYEYVIKDNFYAIYDGIVFRAGVRYKGDKDEVTFEDLEGRRHYLKRLCNQIISTGSLYDYTKY